MGRAAVGTIAFPQPAVLRWNHFADFLRYVTSAKLRGLVLAPTLFLFLLDMYQGAVGKLDVTGTLKARQQRNTLS